MDVDMMKIIERKRKKEKEQTEHDTQNDILPTHATDPAPAGGAREGALRTGPAGACASWGSRGPAEEGPASRAALPAASTAASAAGADLYLS